MTCRLPFQILLHRSVVEGATPFPGLPLFTPDTYFLMLSVKQGGIKYYFLSLWYDLTRRIGEQSTHQPIYIYIYIYISVCVCVCVCSEALVM